MHLTTKPYLSMPIHIAFLLLLLSSSCSSQTTNSAPTTPTPQLSEVITPIDSPPVPPRIAGLGALNTVSPAISYETIKQQIASHRRQLAAEDWDLTASSQAFKNALVHQIMPFWEGTPWSFEGHVSKPQSGSIACGYFVSTTLQHIGLNLNRYRLAQQSPINEAKSLALDIEVKEIAAGNPANNSKAINNYLQEGIHFIGFDQSHVGFILKEKGQLYLIHSNYMGTTGVELEAIETSVVFQSYDRFYLVELSTNPSLLRAWLNQTTITIIKE